MKHVKRFLALSLAAALLAGCVSCGNSDEKTSPTGGGSGVDSTGDGGTLRIAMTCAALPNTDSEPTEGQEGYRFVSFQLYDALVKWDASSETEAGKIIPGLATSWEQNPENPKRWTFHLREGVKFHDGTDFNADCVIFALDRVMNPDFEYYSTTCAASVGSFLANIESYAKVDDYTITIDTVQDNNAYLIYDLPYIMIPSMEAVKEKGDGFADAPVGSGHLRRVGPPGGPPVRRGGLGRGRSRGVPGVSEVPGLSGQAERLPPCVALHHEHGVRPLCRCPRPAGFQHVH